MAEQFEFAENGDLVEKEAAKKAVGRYYQPEVDGESPCVWCPNARECVSFSALVPSYNKDYHKSAPDLRKWWAGRVKRMHPPENEAMREGKRIHEELAKERGVVVCERPEDLSEVFKALGEVGKTVRWTARLCSRAESVRGQPDCIVSTRVAPDRIYHRVIEDKSFWHPHKKYFSQAASEALVLSDPKMIANGLYFKDHIPADGPVNIDVDFELHFYATGKTKSYQFVRDGKFIKTGEGGIEPGAEYIFGIKRLIKKFSGLTRVKDIADIPRCGYCPCVDSNESAVNGGLRNPADMCHVWPLCKDDLLAPKAPKQRKLGRWVRKSPATLKNRARNGEAITWKQ